MEDTFYWHDYETWGADPRRDRPCQFAGLRTDTDLNEIAVETPLVCFCRPSADFLPSPDACLVTGLTPQRAQREGLPEALFAAAIQRELARPGTCSVGYNSIRFDEEISRFLFYRNFRDPYGHAFRNGNSRWDLIDVMRMAHALRPDGITWPRHPTGEPSFRLEQLTAANGIEHQDAHDALADVRATLALARRLRAAQPKLFNFALELRSKHRVRELLESGRPVLHVSSKYPATRGCIAPVMVVAPPSRDDSNGMIVWDLRDDPAELFELSVDGIRNRVFTRVEELPDNVTRLPLKKLRMNAVPMVAPLGTLSGNAADQWSIDVQRASTHWKGFRENTQAASLAAVKVRAAFSDPTQSQAHADDQDPDDALYAGFIPDADLPLMERVRGMSPSELARARLDFRDPRLSALLLRYRARSWPESLSVDERALWDRWRIDRVMGGGAGGLSLEGYQRRLHELRTQFATDQHSLELLRMLSDWGDQVIRQSINAAGAEETRPASAPAG